MESFKESFNMRPNEKIGVVVKGYCETPDNEVFAIYDLHKGSTFMIPCTGVMDIHEACDVLGDMYSMLNKDGYKVIFDIRPETEFDVTKNKPQLMRV